MKALLPFALVPLLATACAERTSPQTDMRLTCQLSKCVCAAPQRAFLASEPPHPVLWMDNGDAYCPDGYQLKLAKD